MENKLESPATGNTTSLEDSLQFMYRTKEEGNQSKSHPCMQRRGGGVEHHVS